MTTSADALEEARKLKESKEAEFEELKSKQNLINIEVDKASSLESYFSNGLTILYNSEIIKNSAKLLDPYSVSLAQNAKTNLQKMKSNLLLVTSHNEKYRMIEAAVKKGTGVVTNIKAFITNIIKLIWIAKTEV